MVRPLGPRFSWPEWVTCLGFVLLAVYLASDPIGRSALKSYEAAVDAFINARGPAMPNFVALGEDGLKLQDGLASPDGSGPTRDTFPVTLEEPATVKPPLLDLSDTLIAPTPTDKDITDDRPAPAASDLFVPERGVPSFLERDNCTRSDALAGLCNGVPLDALQD